MADADAGTGLTGPTGPPALRALLDHIAREQGYRDHRVGLTPVSTGGGNYTSELFLVTVAAPGSGRADLRLFAKVANIVGKMRDEAPVAKFYETERFVYETLVRVYGELEEKSSVPAEHRLYFPKYYGCDPTACEETIVLEDLGALGFGTYDRLRSVDWPYAAAAVAELAKLHALSFAYERDAPEEFAAVVAERRFEFGSDEKMKGVWEGMVRGAVGACRERNRARLARYLAENAGTLRSYYEPLRRPVLTHGDFRPSNLMHKVKPDGGLELVAVDYQTLRAGSAPADLLYLVFAGSDAAFRARHYSRLVDEYYARLRAALRRHKLDPDRVYPREDFDYELKQSLPYGLLISVFVLPLVTVEAADAPRLDDVGLGEWRVAPSSLFADRLNGIVDDYVAWGVL